MLDVRSPQAVDRQNGLSPVPRITPLELPPGYFVLHRGPGQYVAIQEIEPGLYRAVSKIRPRRNLAAQDVYRLVALPPRNIPADQEGE